MAGNYPLDSGDRLTFERILLERAALTGLPLDDKVLTYINWLLESLLPAFDNERPSRSDLAAFVPEGRSGDDYYDWEVEDNDSGEVTRRWDTKTHKYFKIK
jgi:hypothetical protein